MWAQRIYQDTTWRVTLQMSVKIRHLLLRMGTEFGCKICKTVQTVCKARFEVSCCADVCLHP